MKFPKKPSPAQEQAKVDRWNKKYPAGTPVVVTKDNGEQVHTKTTRPAMLLSGHTAVVWLEDISGCYKLDRVKAA